jgi:hypothetical protein
VLFGTAAGMAFTARTGWRIGARTGGRVSGAAADRLAKAPFIDQSYAASTACATAELSAVTDGTRKAPRLQGFS